MLLEKTQGIKQGTVDSLAVIQLVNCRKFFKNPLLKLRFQNCGNSVEEKYYTDYTAVLTNFRRT